MTNDHLTDEILQAYLFEEMQDDAIASHISVCKECRKKIENYQQLVNNLTKISPDSFAFDVTTLVMNNIVQYETQKSKKQELVFWGFLMFLLVSIASFALPYVPQLLSFFVAIPNVTKLFIVGTGIMVVLFLLIDLIKQYKLKEEKMFKNNLQPIL